MKKIKYLVMDVDGTLTDGKIYMGNGGESMKAFSIKDGCGIHDIAIPAGIVPIIITGRKSQIVENRCRELGINHIYQGISNKVEMLKEILTDEQSVENLGFDMVAYIGDDINDLECMRKVKQAGGLVGCPNDAVLDVQKMADFVSTKNGGDGAVRDFIEWMLQERIK